MFLEAFLYIKDIKAIHIEVMCIVRLNAIVFIELIGNDQSNEFI